MQLSHTHKQNILLIIFLGVLSFSLFSPIASNDYIPKSSDFTNHIVNIIESKKALEEGQFPVRVAPSLYQGWRYPYYQFYAPLAYTFTGAVYKWLTPDNPFLAYKVTLWFFLIVGGWYIFRLTKELIYSESIALLTSVVFLLSPYLLLNMMTRGDLTESIASCVVPAVLYYNIRFQRWPSIHLFFCMALAWFVLATTHILAFLTSVLFIGLFLTCYNIQEFIPLKRLLLAGLAFVFSILLALWYFVPAVMLEPYLYAHYMLSNPYYYRWLNPLATLLSVSPVSPIPLPGNGQLLFPFYVSIGWPVLISAGYILYKKIADPETKIPPAITIFLCLFFLAVFLVWSPVNFWQFLPVFCKSIQFGFRFMLQIMWIGALLFAWMVSALFKNKIDTRHIVIGILLIGIANGAWLQTNQSSQYSVKEIIQAPRIAERSALLFVVRPDFLKTSEAYLPVEKTQTLCHQEKTVTHCEFEITKQQTLQLPVLFYPGMLDMKMNGQPISYKPIPSMKSDTPHSIFQIYPMLASIELSPGHYTITSQFIGVRWANVLSIGCWMIMLLWGIYSLLRYLCSFLKASPRG
ncbi:MAG TPA: 6-pyruvoyl-tetrahydropterin synthase-related protein [Gammaproteobacteria bacterium]|nr:6-pyruvoyl-tetrahydropterin synthase-related protein [Gammaproteobacteria bacterium]